MEIRINAIFVKDDFSKFLKQYHFEESDLKKIKDIYGQITPLLKPMAHFNISPDNTEAHALITLGSGIDELMNSFLDKGAIFEAYVTDSIGAYLLTKAYIDFCMKLEAVSGKFINRLIFLGEKGYPIFLVNTFIEELKPDDITVNEAFILSPSKTVSLVLPLDAQKLTDSACNICATCTNFNCLQRNQNHSKNK